MGLIFVVWLVNQSNSAVYVPIYSSTSPRGEAFQNALRIPNANGKRVYRVYRVKIPRRNSIRRKLRARLCVTFDLLSPLSRRQISLTYTYVCTVCTRRGNFEFIPCARAVSVGAPSTKFSYKSRRSIDSPFRGLAPPPKTGTVLIAFGEPRGLSLLSPVFHRRNLERWVERGGNLRGKRVLPKFLRSIRYFDKPCSSAL